ncbi:PREDICTED: uncharacterized protein LOC105149263 [Acromyrmex echinatior]|uniref:uncharacterized protein LOC105149263 n=1 Tax=Acromyrmex echinatior TaxID=103372 RepID=UPI000580FF96|nr:PREDICTED: uncharacterized protein LOC105149263 [Acromyrmex echinatior]
MYISKSLILYLQKFQDCTANTVAKIFFTHWVAREPFGVPRLITTAQGLQFEAQLYDTLTKLKLGSKRCRKTAYHPESNGIIERWHRSLKTALMCHGETQWTDTLPVVLLGLRTCLKEDLGASVAELVYGITLKVSAAALRAPMAALHASVATLIRSFFPLLRPFTLSGVMACRVQTSCADNIVADALSRADTIVMPTSLDVQEIAEAQASDDELQQLKQSTSTSLKLKKFILSETASNIYWDTSEQEIRPYLPGPLRRRDMVHQMSHPSGRATHRQIAQKFVWPSISKDIKEWALV